MNYRVITGMLIARTAVHIGSGEENALTDALLRRDVEGKPLIPGTAIAGALRAMLTRLSPMLGGETCAALQDSGDPCNCPVCHLFGDINPSDKDVSSSTASNLLVFNASVIGDVSQTIIRDGVGIDRVTGASAGAAKFDMEVMPPGSQFELRMELRGTDQKDELLLAAALAEWKEGRVWLGGRVARGLGAFDLREIEYKTHSLDTADDLLAFLRSEEPWNLANAEEDWIDKHVASIRISPFGDLNNHVTKSWVTIEGTLQSEGALLTSDSLVSGLYGFDHAPLLAQLGDWKHPVLTGAGLRGVIRSHGERIARTLATLNADNEVFLKKCPACNPLEGKIGEPLPSCDSLLKKAKHSSKTEVKDNDLCLACRLFGSTRRGSRFIVEDAPYESTPEQKEPVLKILDFLAIDRFTGGGAESLKFDALTLWKPAFSLRLHLDNPAEWEIGWLMFVLRDMADGWLSVGAGTTKGLGRVKLVDWSLRFGYLRPEDSLSTSNLGPSSKDGIYNTVTLDPKTKDWLELA